MRMTVQNEYHQQYDNEIRTGIVSEGGAREVPGVQEERKHRGDIILSKLETELLIVR